MSALMVGDEHRGGFDAVVLAVPPHRLQALLADIDTKTAAAAAAFTTQPIVDVHLWYEVPQPLLGSAGFAALIDSPVQWVFEKSTGYLCCSLSAAADTVQLSEPELARRCHTSLAAVLPQLRSMTPHRVAVTRDADATFVPSPGLLRPGPRTALRNVVIAGAWTDTGWPATMESAVRSGRIAAAAVADILRDRQPSHPTAAEYAHAV
ncbi:MAG: FAD-dependent oxidoreductase [Gammaproteobacteria bacterium]|nr:FAD-dependent oxidoreductase [Gammaproteobacteria bacterium]